MGYQVYLRSFADGDGDGWGDLAGLRARLEHLAWLGVDVVWISPLYPSPLRDGGYDVADYLDVDPRLGSLEELGALVSEAHALGLRILLDLVPNHTSSDHPWFMAARGDRDSPYRDHYVWRDPAPDGGPPNNWPAHFGGPAWTYDDASGQYWLHLFLPHQPDLNWQSPAVDEAFADILERWLAWGIDGVRIDVAHALVKHPDLPDLPPAPGQGDEVEVTGGSGVGVEREFERYAHVHDADQPGVTEIYRRWRAIADRHDALLLGEVYLLEPQRLRRYVADQDGLHLAFWFAPLHLEWSPAAVRAALREGLEEVGPWLSWPLASHDRPRSATALGGGDLGRARALCLATLVCGLPGLPMIYQGEELGLTDVPLPHEVRQDPIAVRGEPERARDPGRTPIPWEPGPGWGFTSADEPWLPIGDRRPEDTVAVQRGDLDSWLQRYRALLATRKGLHGSVADEPVDWLAPDGPIVAYRRGPVVVAANCGQQAATLTLDGRHRIVRFASARAREGQRVAEELPLEPHEAVVLGP